MVFFSIISAVGDASDFKFSIRLYFFKAHNTMLNVEHLLLLRKVKFYKRMWKENRILKWYLKRDFKMIFSPYIYWIIALMMNVCKSVFVPLYVANLMCCFWWTIACAICCVCSVYLPAFTCLPVLLYFCLMANKLVHNVIFKWDGGRGYGKNGSSLKFGVSLDY